MVLEDDTQQRDRRPHYMPTGFPSTLSQVVQSHRMKPDNEIEHACKRPLLVVSFSNRELVHVMKYNAISLSTHLAHRPLLTITESPRVSHV